MKEFRTTLIYCVAWLWESKTIVTKVFGERPFLVGKDGFRFCEHASTHWLNMTWPSHIMIWTILTLLARLIMDWPIIPESDREGFFWEKRYHQRLPKWWLSLKIVIKDCRSDGCLERLSSKTTSVMAVCKNCHQRLPKWWLSVKIVIKDYRSDGCL